MIIYGVVWDEHGDTSTCARLTIFSGGDFPCLWVNLEQGRVQCAWNLFVNAVPQGSIGSIGVISI